MNAIRRIRNTSPVVWTLAVAIISCALTQDIAAQQGPEPGPRPAHRHEPNAQMIEGVRKIVPPLANSSDEQIASILKMMPPNYEWYLSESNTVGDVGVLVVTHGFGEQGDTIFAESLNSVAAEYPTAVAYGMAMMTSDHIRDSINDLVAAGAKKIIVVPATQSRFDTGIRQYSFIVGARDEPAYMKVPQVETEASIIVTPPIGDHSLASAILLDHAREISKNEAEEVVVIVGHGPAGKEDNDLELEMMRGIADQIEADSDFSAVHVINLQDDAEPEVRNANVQALRTIVEAANSADRPVLIVGFLLGTAGIQPKIEKDLAGLEFRFNPRGMSENPKFAAWVADEVQRVLDAG
jgi:Pyruvate/2-oxoacid:ferredoxin oxidoreductase gamma subunit